MFNNITMWAPMPDAPNYFLINNYGQIYSCRTNRFLAQNLVNGYLSITTRFGSREAPSYTFRTHIQVAKAFVPNPFNYPVINHLDGNKLNPFYGNLEWTTHQGNTQHALECGLTKPAEWLTGSNLTITDIGIAATNEQNLSLRERARQLGVSHQTLSHHIDKWHSFAK